MFNTKGRRKRIFEKIYKKKKWGAGEKPTDFYSGSGSYRNDLCSNYVNIIRKFIYDNEIRSILDVGCGDFNIASGFAGDVETYIGMDIVDELVARNNREFGTESIRFEVADLVDDELPSADLLLARQVLQHLTNTEIAKVLRKIGKYRFVIITEHVYNKNEALEINSNIDSSRANRRNKKSGVYLEEPPFEQKVMVIDRIPYNEHEEIIMYLIDNSTR